MVDGNYDGSMTGDASGNQMVDYMFASTSD